MNEMQKLSISTACFVLAAHGQTAPQASTANHNTFMIRSVRIFDGAKVIRHGGVMVENGMISAVGSDLEAPSGIPVIDGTGKTLLPGLIDAHVHTMGDPNFLKSALALGVTTELDMGAAPQFADRIEKEQAEGKDMNMADLRSSRTQPTAPDGHGTEYGLDIPTVSSPQEAAAMVDSLVSEGADFIGEIVYDDGSEYGLKIPTLSKENLRAVIDAAHHRGKLAVVHVLSLQGAKDAIAAGADGLVHLFADQPADSEFFALEMRHHAFIVPTLSLLSSMAGNPAGPALAQDPRLEPYLTSWAITDLQTSLPRRVGNLSYPEETVRRLKQREIPILAGTDAHNPGTAHGASLLSELELLVQSGLSPTDALASATSINASSFRLNDRGRIAPGMRADLLLVDGDPTSTIGDVYRISDVWKRGVRVDRECYRIALDRLKQAEEAQRHSPSPSGSESGLVSNFDDGTMASTFGSGWKAAAGRLLGGRNPVAQISVVDGGAEGSRNALQITGEIAPGVFGWAGAMFFPGPAPMAPVNLSDAKAISFWAKGDGRPYQLMLFSRRKGTMPASKSFVAGPTWEQFVLPLSGFGTDGRDLQGLLFAGVAVPGHFSVLIDDVRLEK